MQRRAIFGGIDVLTRKKILDRRGQITVAGELFQ
jgi:hypothetical protein